jgi:flagellar hook assembly protein FlgD
VFTIQDVTAAPLPGQPTLALLGLIAPNPSRGTTAVAYSLSSDAHVLLTIHDVLGRRVATLLDGRKVSGTWTARWGGHDVGGAIAPSGMYWVRFAVDGRVQTGRFTLLR